MIHHRPLFVFDFLNDTQQKRYAWRCILCVWRYCLVFVLLIHRSYLSKAKKEKGNGGERKRTTTLIDIWHSLIKRSSSYIFGYVPLPLFFFDATSASSRCVHKINRYFVDFFQRVLLKAEKVIVKRIAISETTVWTWCFRQRTSNKRVGVSAKMKWKNRKDTRKNLTNQSIWFPI